MSSGVGFALPDRSPVQFRISQADGITAYYAGHGADIVSANQAAVVNNLQFVPFYTGFGGTIDQVGFNVITGGTAGSVCRAGIYDSDGTTPGGWLQPRNLLVDGGEYDTTTATFKLTTLSPVLTVPPDQLYWLAFLCGVAAPSALTGISSGWHVLGRSATLAAQFGRVKTGFAYGPLPQTAPTGLGQITSGPPMVVYRWATYNSGLRLQGV